MERKKREKALRRKWRVLEIYERPIVSHMVVICIVAQY